MITNIILGVILGAILGIFFILNNKINKIISDITLIKRDLIYIDRTNSNSNKLINRLTDRINDFISNNNELFNVLKTKYNTNIEWIEKRLILIHSELNDINTLIKNKTKSAKISSKNKSYSKTNKSTNK